MTAKKAQVALDKNDLQSYVQEAKNLLDSQLHSLAPIIGELRLHKQIEYTLQTQGKRLRSILVLLSGESVGGDRTKLQKLALAIELLHSATLVHDDILDQDMFRRNALSVYSKWSVKEAILVGDALASLALSMCRNYRSEILDVMSNTCLQLSDGEYLDVQQTTAALSEKDYLEKVEKKSASLFQAATMCGALASNGSSSEVEALAGFGNNFGLAFQIKDDVQDVTSIEHGLPPDVKEFRATLPFIHLYKTAHTNTDGLLQKLDLAKKKNPIETQAILGELQSNLENSGSIRYCSRKIDQYIERAIEGLGPLRESVYKEHLIQIAESLRLS